MPWRWQEAEIGCFQGPGITAHGARCALCTSSTAAVLHSHLFSYLVAALREAAALLEAQVTSAGMFLSAHPPSGSLCNPLPSCCFDTLVDRGHISRGWKYRSGEKFNRSLKTQSIIINSHQISECNAERTISIFAFLHLRHFP